MKKLLAVGVIVLFLGISVIPSTGITDVKQSTMPTAKGDTLYVGGNGTGNYSKIQDAINDSSDGDTVYVYDDSSPYLENINISKSINLIGEDKVTTIIDGYLGNTSIFSYYSIYIYAGNVTVSGFTIQNENDGDGYGVGIYIYSDNNVITDNIISNNGFGGLLVHRFKNFISYNSISDNKYYGIHTVNSKHTIIGNEIEGNHIGISLSDGSSSLISHNNISNNIVGIDITWATNISIIQNNFIINKISAIFSRAFIGELLDKITDRIIRPEYYDPYYLPLRRNIWDGNYWNKPRTIPKAIFGSYRIIVPRAIYLGNIPIPINFINIDWNPAQEPYDIGV